MSTVDHLHIYNLRGFCWCGAHRDDWLRDEKILELVGKALRRLNEEPSEEEKP